MHGGRRSQRRAPLLAGAAAILFVLAMPSRAFATQGEYFEIRVVDGAGAPVPCVELRTTGQIELRTDATGRAAFFEPGLMDQGVWFSVSGSHVQVAPDGFGFAGESLAVSEGVADRVHFAGSIDHDLMPLILSASDVMVLPTVSEGLANAEYVLKRRMRTTIPERMFINIGIGSRLKFALISILSMI